jgi:hypothetical protein
MKVLRHVQVERFCFRAVSAGRGYRRAAAVIDASYRQVTADQRVRAAACAALAVAFEPHGPLVAANRGIVEYSIC